MVFWYYFIEATSGGGIHITSKVSAEEWPLIQPSQVNVQLPPVHIAESILTPLGILSLFRSTLF